ncbi:MAG: hypothetical protein KKH49_06640, partial [Candidatus Omnitrophica bacterium]|nr:hypothetical protein [Candidatus Omnitrophota bacterium]
FLMYFVQSMIATTWNFFFTPQDQLVNKGIYILMMWVYLLIPLAIAVFFLFKREKILNMLIGKSEQQEVQQFQTLPCYGRLAFWIQILGLYYLISTVARAIPRLIMVISRSSHHSFKYFFWQDMGGSTVMIILFFLLIWKSEVIADFINKITKQPQSK